MLVQYGIVYLVRNRKNGKVYIGQTTRSLSERWLQHQWFARKGKKGLFFSAIRKYGAASFDATILHHASSREELDEMERRAIWSHDSTNREVGYNIAAGGNGGSGPDHFNYGVPKTPEHVAKLKEAFKHRPPLSEETKRKIGLSSRGRTHTVSPEARKRMGDLQRGKHKGADNPFFGKKHSPETIARISDTKFKNRKPDRKTGLFGVTFDPSPGRAKPYRVRIRVNGKSKRFGNFATAEEAARAYNNKAIELFGDKALLNDI